MKDKTYLFSNIIESELHDIYFKDKIEYKSFKTIKRYIKGFIKKAKKQYHWKFEDFAFYDCLCAVYFEYDNNSFLEPSIRKFLRCCKKRVAEGNKKLVFKLNFDAVSFWVTLTIDTQKVFEPFEIDVLNNARKRMDNHEFSKFYKEYKRIKGL